MRYRIGPFELNAGTFELRRAGAAVAVEPQVLSLLLLLVEHRDRLVTKDEIIEAIWKGRIVSEAAISSRIKSARQALGDDGRRQGMIRTVHGRGFRFIGAVEAQEPAVKVVESVAAQMADASEAARPSIAVLPFHRAGDAGENALIAEALPHELIAELSRLRWLFVIARGSSFRFREVDPDIAAIGEVLGVRYCLSGSLEAAANRITVTVELADTRDRGVVWGDSYSSEADGVHELRLRIVSSIIAALEIQIPLHEARQARLKSPQHLDAWSAYHLGLQHMFRFNQEDNAAAIALFDRAVAKEPDFARALAGLSFAHFQNAFLNYTADLEAETLAARRFAERALETDALDPFANFTLGRSLWLAGNVEGSLGWLDRAVDLCPNYAQAIYSRAFAETLLGAGEAGQRHADAAMALSPLDPLLYGMMGVRAMSHLVRGEEAEAAHWADRAARAPGAHVLISMIAVAFHALNGDTRRGRFWADDVRHRQTALTQADFFRSFPLADAALRERISKALTQFGL